MLINPWQEFKQGRCIDGIIETSQFTRIPGLIDNSIDKIYFAIEFYCDTQQRYCIKGHINGKLWLTCQRCLKPVANTIDTKINLALVSNYEAAKQLPDMYEPVIFKDGNIRSDNSFDRHNRTRANRDNNKSKLSILDLIEDEIILVLPYVPTHPIDMEGETCQV